MDTFTPYYNLISKPKKIAAFSFDQNGNILENETENRVFLNDNILKKKYVNIDLTKYFDNYEHMIEEYKVFFRSNMLLEFYKRGNGELKKSLVDCDFFVTRGTLSALSGAKGQGPIISWAFVVDGVIAIVKDESLNSRCGTLSNYIGLYFENIITSKNGDGNLNFEKQVNSWEQYKEIYTIDVNLPNGELIKVAYSCEIDAFDKNSMVPLEIKTQYLNNPSIKGKKVFGYFKSINVCLQCMFGNIHEIVVGYKDENNVVSKITKYPVKRILQPFCISNEIEKCCIQLRNRLDEIKKLFIAKNNKGCVKIETSDNSDKLILTYFPEIVPEVKDLFTEKFCKTFL